MVNDPCLPQEAVSENMEFAHCALLASIHCCDGLRPCAFSHFIGDLNGDLVLFVPPGPHFVSIVLSIFFLFVLFLNAKCMNYLMPENKEFH